MEQDPNQQPAGNFVIIETHLQVSNLIKILFTIPYDILKLSVENIPEEVANTQHANVLRATLNYYTTVASFSQAPDAPKEEETAAPQATPEPEVEVVEEDTAKANVVQFTTETTTTTETESTGPE